MFSGVHSTVVRFGSSRYSLNVLDGSGRMVAVDSSSVDY